MFPLAGGPLFSSLELEVIANVSEQTRVHDIMVVYTDPSPGDTPVGHDILVTLRDGTGNARFENVFAQGVTDATPRNSSPIPS